MSYLIVAAETRCEGVAVEVFLNGGAVSRNFDLRSNMNTNKLNPWLVVGSNRLEVRVAAVDKTGTFLPHAQLNFAVFEGAHGEHPGAAGKLGEISWSQSLHPLAGSGFQSVGTLDFQSRAPTPPWRWLDGLPYSEADRPAIEACLVKLHGALVARDFDALAALTQLRDHELALALDVSPARLVALERQSVAALFQAKVWQVAPLDPGALEFHARAGGRLVEATSVALGPALSATADGETVHFRYTLAHLPGTDPQQPSSWNVIR